MNIKMKVTNFLWLVFCLAPPLSAQQGFVSSGGDIHNSNGSVAYSIGQVAYESVTNEAGSVNQGIQQTFHLSLVSISELQWNTEFFIYPNPADQHLFLKLSSDESQTQVRNYSARVYDVQGKLLLNQRLKNEINMISLSGLPVAMYFIQVWEANTFIQSNSFSKTN